MMVTLLNTQTQSSSKIRRTLRCRTCGNRLTVVTPILEASFLEAPFLEVSVFVGKFWWTCPLV